MSVTVAADEVVGARRVPVFRGYRFRFVSQWRIRLACWVVPVLVRAGVAVRELAPVVSPLEAAFLALTEQREGGR